MGEKDRPVRGLAQAQQGSVRAGGGLILLLPQRRLPEIPTALPGCDWPQAQHSLQGLAPSSHLPPSPPQQPEVLALPALKMRKPEPQRDLASYPPV